MSRDEPTRKPGKGRSGGIRARRGADGKPGWTDGACLTAAVPGPGSTEGVLREGAPRCFGPGFFMKLARYGFFVGMSGFMVFFPIAYR